MTLQAHRESVDTLIFPRWVVPVSTPGALEDHAVAVSEGRIVAVLPAAEARQRFVGREEVLLPQSALMPGLVNLHVHSAMSLLRGCADDLPLKNWLEDRIWPIEAAVVAEDFVRDGTRLACAEMLLGGMTCFNDMYFFPGAVAEAALDLGMRACVGLLVMDFATKYASGGEEGLKLGLECRDRLRSEALLHFALAPHAPYTVGDELFGKVAEIAAREKLPIHCHLHESAQEVEDGVKAHGVRPAERLRRLGVLGSNFIAVHSVHLSDEEVALFSEKGVSVAHCPSSNIKLASGIAPLEKLRLAGVNVGLGTDGAAANNRLDLWTELRTAALLAKVGSGSAAAWPAQAAIHAATLGGAKALGLDHKIGSIDAGKQADLIAVDFSALELQPVYDPVSHLAYVIGREQVTDVWVAGRRRVRDRTLCDVDVSALRATVDQWAERIQKLRS